MGAINNNFLGDSKVETILPTGAGNSTGFTPNAGANWECLDDSAQDGDSTYVSAGTPGLKDTYVFGDLASTPAFVAGIQATIVHRKDDAGSRTAAIVIRSGGVDYEGANIAVSDSYAFTSQIFEKNPDGDVAWTGASINAMEAGVKLIA